MFREHRLENTETPAAGKIGNPEVLVPDAIITWMQGQEYVEEDLSLVSLGCRYSPKAVRAGILALCNGIYTEDGYIGPPSTQFRIWAGLYAYFNDFISAEEFTLMAQGKAIRGNMPESLGDMYIGPQGRQISNSIHATMEEVGVILNERRKKDPKLRVLLLDGKFNTVPHPGHMFLIRDSLTQIETEESISMENIAVVVACSDNEYIKASGNDPFLILQGIINTAILLPTSWY